MKNPGKVTIDLTKEQIKKLQPFFDYCAYYYEQNKRGMLLAQLKQFHDKRESWIDINFIEKEKADIIIAVSELILKDDEK